MGHKGPFLAGWPFLLQMETMQDDIVSIITGANRGIGLEVARQLFARGHTIIAGTRKSENAPGTGNENSPRWFWRPLDVTSEISINALSAWVERQFGKVDVLINNAGVIDKEPLAGADVNSIKQTMDTNFYGPMRMNSSFIPLLARGRDPRIINVSSQMGAYGSLLGGYAGYRLSKAGLNAQTALLAHEVQERGIRVNAVCPGWVRTDMGGTKAPGTATDGADSIVWLATNMEIPNGKFISGRKIIDW